VTLDIVRHDTVLLRYCRFFCCMLPVLLAAVLRVLPISMLRTAVTTAS
jgi:hypothetical protein